RLIEVLGLSPLTVNRKLSSIRKYLEFGVVRGYISQMNGFVLNVSKPKSQKEGSAGISLSDFREESEKKRDTIRNYSKIPPVRLIQKLMLPYLLFEGVVADKIAATIKSKKLA